MVRALVNLSLLAFVSSMTLRGIDQGELLIQAPAGSFLGHLDGGVRRWDGIPYAKPPVGDRRLRNPEPLDHLDEV